LPFVVGSVWSDAKYLDVIVDKGRELARVPMTLRMEPLTLPTTPPVRECPRGELVFVEGGRVVVRCGDCDIGELVTAPGTIWKAHCALADRAPDVGHGAVRVGKTWNLHHPRSTVGFSVQPGELRKMTLSFEASSGLSKDPASGRSGLPAQRQEAHHGQREPRGRSVGRQTRIKRCHRPAEPQDEFRFQAVSFAWLHRGRVPDELRQACGRKAAGRLSCRRQRTEASSRPVL
jgi:hypothetical protein